VLAHDWGRESRALSGEAALTVAEVSEHSEGTTPQQTESDSARIRPPRRRRAWVRELWLSRPNLFAFMIIGSMILGLGGGAWLSGYHLGFWPNFLLNGAGDLVGGMVLFFLIEPIVRQATELQQIRQHPRLDYGWFLHRVGEARDQIRILDTFTSLFAGDRDAAIRTLRDAAVNGVNIRVLLLSPNTDASALREFQLRQAMPGMWINDRIQKNIADFRQLEAAILAVGNGRRHGRFELRVYTVAAPFSLYGWDERALFAFLPPHAFSDQSTQLEITDRSQLGEEARDQFEAIWQDAAPIPQLLPVEVVDEQAKRDLLVRFVHADNNTYLVSKRIDAAILANPALLICIGDPKSSFQPEMVAPDDAILERLNTEFFNKYARRPDASFNLLRPQTDDETPTDRPREHDALPIRTLIELIENAQHSIRILDTSSTLMAEGSNQFTRAVEAAMKRGVKAQVLLLAPTTQAAQDRAAEIQDPNFDTKIEENIRELRRLAHKMTMSGVDGDRLEVRLYDRLPECSVHQVDDRLVVAFLPYQRRTSRVQHLEVGQDASLGKFADIQFTTTWDHARPLEGMRYADLTAESETKHLLLRIWDTYAPDALTDSLGADTQGPETRRARYLASNRIEGIIAETNAARGGHARATELVMEVEDEPGERYVLSEPIPIASIDGLAAAAAFAAIFGVDPDAPIRRLDPVAELRTVSIDPDELADIAG
jgi:hypothetical protein